MGIEWFRDLSIIIMAITTTVLVYRLYRKADSTLQLVKSTAKIVYNAVSLIKQGPLTTIVSLIQGIRSGIESISSLFKKEVKKGESTNE